MKNSTHTLGVSAMTTIPIKEASLRLSELVDQLQSGEKIGLTRGSETIAWLVKNSTQKQTRLFGLGKGVVA